MAMSERDRRALMLGGTALGVLAVYFLGIEPLWGWCGNLAGEHQTRAARMARMPYVSMGLSVLSLWYIPP